MKIIYSAGNRIGANTQLARFLDNIDKKKHQIKTAAYLKSSYSISNIDWTLNAIHKNIPKDLIKIFDIYSTRYNQDVINQLLNDVAVFNPDLIISDNEHIFAQISHEMNVPLWYCSPLLLSEGIDWDFRKKINYSYFVNLDLVNKFQIFPSAEKCLIYSPFCDLKNKPEFRVSRDDDWNPICRYDWVRPYFYKPNSNICIDEYSRFKSLHKILKHVDLNDYYFTDGNTNNISDAIYNKKKILISPSLNNKESLLNAILLDRYKIGVDVAQVELMNKFSIEEIENAMETKLNKIQLFNSKNLQLHEMIDELANNKSGIDISV